MTQKEPIKNPRTLKEQRSLIETTYFLFVQSMDTHYSEILKFLAIIIPTLTGFFYVLYLYESSGLDPKIQMGFLFVAIVVICVQAWGAVYALAMSYRFRYLQATVSRIEADFGVDHYMPASFKTRRITGFRRRLFLDVAPAILQVHVFFFISTIVLIAVVSCLSTPRTLNVVIAAISLLLVVLVLFMGGLYYPNKLNKMLDDLDQKGSN